MEDPKITQARRLIMEKFQLKDPDLVLVERVENEKLVTYSFRENSKRFRVSFLGEKVIDIFRY
tara:strand:+ start:50 stop:238 length:189 start_codon:yes stop_codon:yes gene_type:complete